MILFYFLELGWKSYDVIFSVSFKMKKKKERKVRSVYDNESYSRLATKQKSLFYDILVCIHMVKKIKKLKIKNMVNKNWGGARSDTKVLVYRFNYGMPK